MGVNIIQFRKDLQKAKNSLSNIAANASRAKLNSNKAATLKAFENDVVTKELDAGENGKDNPSNTLPGLKAGANLFSFLGFNAGDKPTDIIREALGTIRQLSGPPQIEEKGNKWVFKFTVAAPTLQSLYAQTPLQDWGAKSWIQAIQNGVSGFQYYIYWMLIEDNPEKSRSTTGTQSKNKLREGKFVKRDYMNQILADFRERLK